MIAKTIKETIREYDKEGNLIRETIKETTESDGKSGLTCSTPDTIKKGSTAMWDAIYSHYENLV